MTTSNIFMNCSTDIRLSQTQHENREEWMENSKCEMEWTLGKEEKLETKYEKRMEKETDVKQTFSPTDNSKDMSTFGRSKIVEMLNSNTKHRTDKIGDLFPHLADQTLPKWSIHYPTANDKVTNLTNPCKSSGLRNLESRFPSYTDYNYKGPRAPRDGGLTQVSGMQRIEKDELFSGKGKHQYGLFYEEGKEVDNNDKDRSNRSLFEQTEIKKKLGSAAKGIGQTVILDYITKSLCSIIDSSREKGLQNTEISKILTNTFFSSMHNVHHTCLKKATSLFLGWLPMAVTQLKCVEGPLKNFFLFLDIILKIKAFLDGRMTLWQLLEFLLDKAFTLGILYFIACMFGPVGCLAATAISSAMKVTKHLFKCFI